jgi:hypothetical protein
MLTRRRRGAAALQRRRIEPAARVDRKKHDPCPDRARL